MTEIAYKDPMTIGKILDRSIQFIFKNILWITLIGFIISFPSFAFEEWMSPLEPSNQLEMIKYKIIFYLISVLLGPILAGTVTLLIGEQFCGRKMALSVAIKKSLKKWIQLVLLHLIVLIVMGLGFFLLIIPGIIALCATACAVPAMMLENLDPMEAFERSWKLTKSNRLRIFGYLILTGLIVAIGQAITGMLVGFGSLIYEAISLDHLSIYTIGMMAILMAPLIALGPAIATLLFFDLRIRKEAFDLEEETQTILMAS